jgi:hypothetical protein
MLSKDTLLTATLAASGGKQVMMYDDKGKPSVMVRIPLFNLQDIHPSLGTGPHPAFIVNGVVKNEIYIGAYQAVVDEGRACSLPGVKSTGSIDFDTAKAACTNKGHGWHLMTAWEWAAIALWCMKNGIQPRGNTQYARSHEATFETGVRTDGRAANDTAGDPRTLTGSGPASWRHDGTIAGISDLVGNVWEWNDGLKMVDGRLYFPLDNDYDLVEGSWPSSPVFFDSTTGPIGGASSVQNGEPVLSDRITHFSETPNPAGGTDQRDITYAHRAVWQSMSVANTYDTLPEEMRKKMAQLLISPKLLSTDAAALFAVIKGGIWTRNYGSRFPLRGGAYSYTSVAGLGALLLYAHRASVPSTVGLRPAFIL